MRKSDLTDLEKITSWVTNQAETDIWSGGSVRFPIEINQVISAIGWDAAYNYSIDKSGAIVAYGQLLEKPNQRLHLARIIVSPEHRGLGLGRLLITGLVTNALSKQPRTVSLNVHPTNKKAIHLYSEFGFVPIVDLVENRNGLFVYMERSE